MNNSIAMTKSIADPSIEIEVVIRALDQVAHPVTVKQLRERLTGPYKLPETRIAQLLEEQRAAGRIYLFSPIGRSKQPRYWTNDLEAYARELMFSLLAKRPHTESELLKKLNSKLAGYNEEQQKALLAYLVREKQIYQLPPIIGSHSKRYSTQPPELRRYIEDALTKISKRLRIAREEVLSEARILALSHSKYPNSFENNNSEKLMARMLSVKLAAAQGGLVPLNELWRSLQNEGWDKEVFDRTVLSLAENYRVALQRHNFPESLTEQDRAELVSDGLGNYYVGIALRIS